MNRSIDRMFPNYIVFISTYDVHITYCQSDYNNMLMWRFQGGPFFRVPMAMTL